MSHRLISLNPDLARLRNEGYAIEIRAAHLLVHDVPYLDHAGKVHRGTLASTLDLVGGDRTARPSTHVAHFIGGFPHRHAGGEIPGMKLESRQVALAEGLTVDHSFSNKPASGYPDYYEKMTRYIKIIGAEARAADSSADARTGRLIEETDASSVFLYMDTASSRAGILALVQRFQGKRIAIVGLGGTGSYVLDFVAKTPVAEIHLFDADEYWQHNAFRSPGATPGSVWSDGAPLKAAFYATQYAVLRRGIVAHEYRIHEGNVHELNEFDFVFICVDRGSSRRVIIDALRSASRSFVDCGVGVIFNEDRTALIASCRVTAGIPGRYNHIDRRVPMHDVDDENLYAANIQLTELNSACAAAAVLLWKKISGFYLSERDELHSQWSISLNSLHSAGEPELHVLEET